MADNDHHLNNAVRNSNHTKGMMMNMREYLLNKQKQIISKNEQIQDELAQIKDLEVLLNEQINIQTEQRNKILSELIQNSSVENNKLLNELFKQVDSMREYYTDRATDMHRNVLQYSAKPYLTVRQKIHLKNEHALHQQRKALIGQVMSELRKSEEDVGMADFILKQQEQQIQAKKKAIVEMKNFYLQLKSVGEQQNWRTRMTQFSDDLQAKNDTKQNITNLQKINQVMSKNKPIVQNMIQNEKTMISTLPCNLVIQEMININESDEQSQGVEKSQNDLVLSQLQESHQTYSSLRRSMQMDQTQSSQLIQSLTFKQSQLQQEIEDNQSSMRKIEIKQDRYDITIHNLQMKILQTRMINQKIMKQIYKLMAFIEPFMQKYNLLDFKLDQTSIFLNRKQIQLLKEEVTHNKKLQTLFDEIDKYQLVFNQK